MPSPLAGHAVNPPVGLGGGIDVAARSRNRRGHRIRELIGDLAKICLLLGVHWKADRRRRYPNNTHHVLLATLRADHLDWSLPAYRRGTLRGMDAA
ncbi:hypothetical protein [Xanthomonas arboricola]